MKNDFTTLNWFFFTKTKKWLPIYTIFLAVVCIVFVYLLILVCLSLCHLLVGHQLYIHNVHAVFIILFLAFCVAMVIAINEMWSEEWAIVWLSVKIFGPYLQVGAVSVMTLMSWLIARKWFMLSSTCRQFFWLLLYLAVMAGLSLLLSLSTRPVWFSSRSCRPNPSFWLTGVLQQLLQKIP